MREKNLPIKVVLQRVTDTKRNKGGGNIKFFGEVTESLQNNITQKFEHVLEFYDDVFNENEFVPAIGKITVKPEAIAKSYKPNDLCRNCPIIGSEDLNEIYVKVTKKALIDTISLVRNPPSQKFRANMTTIEDIQPITAKEKITKELTQIITQGNFNEISKKIKVKYFDFDNEFDNNQILHYILEKLKKIGLENNYTLISYGESIKFIKIEVDNFEQINKIASINGVKSVDFFQQYSLPTHTFLKNDITTLIDDEYSECDTIIGIIDGGISDDNPYLEPYIIGRENYVNPQYHNYQHGTFIASTIQYGNQLNGLNVLKSRRFKFLDIIALPNSDETLGPVDYICEEELMEIIDEVVEKYSSYVKIWNLSLGIEAKKCNESMSDLGIFLDYIQDKYGVQCFVSSGNINQLPLRQWPPQSSIGEHDRLISPADSVRSITVGSIALYDSKNSIVKANEPSPFSRRGPGANYIVKPDVVDYGGNLSNQYSIQGLGVKGLDIKGNIIEGNGTSYSTPRVVQKFSSIYDEMVTKDILLAKAMVIHSARMNTHSSLNQNQDLIKYYGFGMPGLNVEDILHCSEHEVTLVFRQVVSQGYYLELFDFPYPDSLIKNNKYYGEICMTLAYNPILDQRYGSEYCRTNIDVSFGTYSFNNITNKVDFKGQVPLECSWDEKFEQARIENGFKWSPIKSYYRRIKNGIALSDGWKIRIDMTPRNGLIATAQEFVLIVTLKAAEGTDIYSEVVNGLRTHGYIANDLETRQMIRQRQ